MKKLLTITLLLGMAGCKQGYYVFGDSLTSPSYSWADRITTHNIQKMAVGGLQLTGFDLPKWIAPNDDMRGVILFLGMNDMGWDVDIDVFSAKLTEVVLQADAQGLEVICVELPVYPWITEAWSLRYAPYIEAQWSICPQVIQVQVTDEVLADSPDTLHWGPDGQELIARQIELELERIEQEQE